MNESGVSWCPRDQVLLWFALRRYAWRILAVVPGDEGGCALPFAQAISRVGSAHSARPVALLDAARMSAGAAHQQLMGIQVSAPEAVVVALPSLLEQPESLSLALGADACLLSLAFGESDLASARRTVRLVGRDRFIGAVAGRPVASEKADDLRSAEADFFGAEP